MKTKEKTSNTFWTLSIVVSITIILFVNFSDRRSDSVKERTKELIAATSHYEIGDTLYAKSTHLACESKEMYKEFVSAAAVNGLNQSMAVYIPRGCTMIFKGVEVTYLNKDWGTAKIIFDHPVRGTIALYTAREVVE